MIGSQIRVIVIMEYVEPSPSSLSVDPDPPEKRAFEGAVAQAFDKVVYQSSVFEVRQRGAAAADALCPGTAPPERR